ERLPGLLEDFDPSSAFLNKYLDQRAIVQLFYRLQSPNHATLHKKRTFLSIAYSSWSVLDDPYSSSHQELLLEVLSTNPAKTYSIYNRNLCLRLLPIGIELAYPKHLPQL
ncbi:MAG: hypothetical protein ACKO96_00610, partial [Flammeovirgaceae bacterium]